jgi:hypothetical protein
MDERSDRIMKQAQPPAVQRSWWNMVRAVVLLPIMLTLPGCLVVRTTEHIVNLNADGSGEAIIHLTDIRSDAPTDSLFHADFNDLMKVYHAKKVDEFERYGRRITGKRFRVEGDTLMAEITYVFTSLEAIEGLRATKDELFLLFPPEREVIRSNGQVTMTPAQGTRISWSRDARKLVYVVREKQLPDSKSLSAMFLKYQQQ